MNTKLQWHKSYHNHWLVEFQAHPIEIEGAWHRICNKMRVEKLTDGSLCRPIEYWCNLLNESSERIEHIFAYINSAQIGCVTWRDKNVTVTSRRIAREERAKEISRMSSRKYREKASCDGPVTGQSKKSKKSKKNKENTPYIPLSTENGFATFWKSYPKKRSKPRAEKAWRKLKPDESLLDRILLDIQKKAQSEDWTKEGMRFCPYPATYLNDRGWEDEGELTRAKKTRKQWLEEGNEQE